MNSSTPQRSVTLRDIADAAGVNPSTVSRAMRGDPRLRPETRAQIQDLARQMRYRPNPFVTAFATHVRNHRNLPNQATIAVLDTYSDELASAGWVVRYEQGIRERAADHGFAVDVLRLRDHGGGADAGKVIDARGIRGVIIMPVRGQTVLTGLDFRSLAASTIDLSLRHPLLHRASPDYFQGIQLALDTLHARRYRRIGFCTNRGEVRRIGSRWLGGYLAWHSDGLPEEHVAPHINPHEEASDEDTAKAAAHWRECRDAFARWLEQEKPDAIVSNDTFFEAWLRELGRRVPGDVAFGSLGLALGASVHAGIDQRCEQVGAAAMDLVISQIYRNEYGLPLIPTTVLVPSTWVDGETTV
jgi:DNA-binding LacI/PurR family transcriptional regulator